MDTKNKEMTMGCHSTITVDVDNATSVSFDLKKIKMTAKQEEIVTKLFAQQPKAVLAPEGHSAEQEKGMPGPGSAYLSKDEFEQIRTLGVRFADSAAPLTVFMDFCLHVAILPSLRQES